MLTINQVSKSRLLNNTRQFSSNQEVQLKEVITIKLRLVADGSTHLRFKRLPLIIYIETYYNEA